MNRFRCFVLFFVFGVFAITFGLVAQDRATDQWLMQPVDDATYQTYLDFFSHDQDLPFETKVIDSVEHEGIQIEHVSFQSTPGVRVFADYYSSGEKSGAEGPAIVVLHGGSAQGKDAQYVEFLVELIVRAGWSALAIDLQYFGERSTDLLTTFTEKEKHDRLYNRTGEYLAWIIQSVKDISRSVDFLVREKGTDRSRIGLFGISRGAQVGMIAGAVERRFVSVMLVHGGHFDAQEKEHLPPACGANFIGRISPRPLLMVNGTRDIDYDRAASITPLFELAGDPKQIIWVEDGGHMSLDDEHRSAMVRWLRQTLK